VRVKCKWPNRCWMQDAKRRARSWSAGPWPDRRRSSSAATMLRTQSDGAVSARIKGHLAGVTNRAGSKGALVQLRPHIQWATLG
jgi:hypothetical protein